MENLVGLGIGLAGLTAVAIVSSPIWIPYRLYSLGKAGYEKLMKKI